MLLHSCPDTVHRFLLRKTQTSTPLIKGCSARYKPQIGITPAVADCRYRAPLSPRLRGSFMAFLLHNQINALIWICLLSIPCFLNSVKGHYFAISPVFYFADSARSVIFAASVSAAAFKVTSDAVDRFRTDCVNCR